MRRQILRFELGWHGKLQDFITLFTVLRFPRPSEAANRPHLVTDSWHYTRGASLNNGISGSGNY
jgi:hypothetical protein